LTPGLELERQHAHADEVRAVNALEAFRDDGLDTGESHAFRGPVARRALSIVSARDDDQRLLALHVGLDRFPHAHDLAVRLHARQRALADLAVDDAISLTSVGFANVARCVVR
jgi:hypothetical protein